MSSADGDQEVIVIVLLILREWNSLMKSSTLFAWPGLLTTVRHLICIYVHRAQ